MAGHGLPHPLPALMLSWRLHGLFDPGASGRGVPWLWQVMRPIAVPFVRTGLRVKVVGRKHIPKKGAAILASNHLSALDHVVLPMATRRTIINISKAEHFSKPFKAWVFRQWGIIKLQRGSGDSGAFEAAKQALREGNLFCIYPEGTRSRDGKLHKGHTGVARLALELHVPVVPVAMVGTFEAKPKGGKLKLFTPTAAIVGEPLDFSRHWDQQDDKAVCRKVTDEVMQAIQRLSGQEYVHEYQHNPEVPSHAKPKEEAGAEGTGTKGSKEGGKRGSKAGSKADRKTGSKTDRNTGSKNGSRTGGKTGGIEPFQPDAEGR